MSVGVRISERLAETGMSQSELARRVGLNQSTIAALIHGKSRSSAHLHRIARQLGTTPAYLEGETDDRSEDAPPPPPEPRVQSVTLQVLLPSEAALADMFEAQLRVFGDLKGAELARALARRLPNGLARLREVPLIEPSADDRAPPEAEEPPIEDRPAVRRARRK